MLFSEKSRRKICSLKHEGDACDHTGALEYLLFARYLSIMRDSWQVHLAWRQIWLNNLMRHEQGDLDEYTPGKG